MKLLIVDDTAPIRNRIASILGDPRLSVQIVGMAKNCAEAITLFLQHIPELVIIDIASPGTEGIDCTEKMLTIHPECKILVISALSEKATALRTLMKGAAGVLYKPFTDDELIASFLEFKELAKHSIKIPYSDRRNKL